MNLASNAVKYSDRQKAGAAAVLIGAVAFANRVRIDILDNGVGIPRDRWEEVFKPFTQLSNPEHDRDKGVGLGLSIVRAIVPLLSEHRLDMNSVEGRGTRFSLELPRADDIIVPAQLAELCTDYIDTGKLAGVYVLYVEDDTLVRNSTVSLFDNYGILCEAVASIVQLEEALSTLERIPDIIITDYRLPEGKTARDVLSAVWRECEVRIPTIVLTGEPFTFDQDAWLGFPVRTHRKPISPGLLIEEVALMSNLAAGEGLGSSSRPSTARQEAHIEC